MSTKILFPGWNQLSAEERSLIEEWVSLELRIREIKGSLLSLNDGVSLERQIDSREIIDIPNEAESDTEAIPIEKVNPKTLLFVDAVKFARDACRSNCNCDGLVGEERKKCRKACQQCIRANAALKLLNF